MTIKIFGDSNFCDVPNFWKTAYPDTSGIPGLPIDDIQLLETVLAHNEGTLIIAPCSEFNGFTNEIDYTIFSRPAKDRFRSYTVEERYFYAKQIHRTISVENRQHFLDHYLFCLEYLLTLKPNIFVLPLSLKWFSRKFRNTLTPDSYAQYINRVYKSFRIDITSMSPREGHFQDNLGHLSTKGYQQLYKLISGL